MSDKPNSILCIACYEKGHALLKELKSQGCHVIFLTNEKLRGAAWPWESIDEAHFMPDIHAQPDVTHAVSWLSRDRKIDRIIPLDDFDVEVAAALREHMRLPGMGDSVARHFRDKLAMRVRARDGGVTVPDFVGIFNRDDIRRFMDRTPGPWVLKPRGEASAVGIKKIRDQDSLWPVLDELGDRQSFFVLEQFITGDVYHVDGIVFDREAVFAECHRYGDPPMKIAHDGGVFMSTTVKRGSDDEASLRDAHARMVRGFGLERGVTHAEFIKGPDGRFYFLETASRVGGANIAEMVEGATGVNLWKEWARVELTGSKERYQLPEVRRDYGTVLITLARTERPDLSAYEVPEIYMRVDRPHHAGLVLRSSDYNRLSTLTEDYRRRFADEFFATMPLPDKPTA